jgi:hypothetical protein
MGSEAGTEMGRRAGLATEFRDGLTDRCGSRTADPDTPDEFRPYAGGSIEVEFGEVSVALERLFVMPTTIRERSFVRQEKIRTDV